LDCILIGSRSNVLQGGGHPCRLASLHVAAPTGHRRVSSGIMHELCVATLKLG
jgi:hypothetical protein